MDEERIEALVRLLLDKDESEIEQTFEALRIPDEEREEIRGRLSELRLPPKGLSPEELREQEHFQQLVHLGVSYFQPAPLLLQVNSLWCGMQLLLL